MTLDKPVEYATERLIIREPIQSDAKDIFKKYTQDPDVTKYLTWVPHKTFNETQKWIDFCIQNATTEKCITRVIVYKESNQAIGMFDFQLHDFHTHFGYVLAKKYWNKGLMTEAMQQAVEYYHQLPEIYRIWAVHDIENPASGRVMTKLGLKYEGTLKRYTIHPNLSQEPRDVCMYALTR